jgi:hypothetical protein
MVALRFNDAEVTQLLSELKPLPSRWERRLLNLRAKRELSQRRSGLAVRGQTGEFEIKVRQSTIQPLDFSVVVAFRKRNENSWFILRRYNGRHPGPHLNKPVNGPKQTIVGFHIHMATEEAQSRGRDEESFAVETSKYADVLSAIEFALNDCNFAKPKVEEDRNPDQYRFWKRNDD